MSDYCPVCHKPYSYDDLPSEWQRRDAVLEHRCELTNDIKFGKKTRFRFEYRASPNYPDRGEVIPIEIYKDGSENHREGCDVRGPDLRHRLQKAVLVIRQMFVYSQRQAALPRPEKWLKTWAILALIPDEGIRCQNLVPSFDLAVDEDSLFSSCEYVYGYIKGDMEKNK